MLAKLETYLKKKISVNTCEDKGINNLFKPSRNSLLFVGITSWYRNSGNKINKERNIINTLSSAIEWATSGNKFLNYHLT